MASVSRNSLSGLVGGASIEIFFLREGRQALMVMLALVIGGRTDSRNFLFLGGLASFSPKFLFRDWWGSACRNVLFWKGLPSVSCNFLFGGGLASDSRNFLLGICGRADSRNFLHGGRWGCVSCNFSLLGEGEVALVAILSLKGGREASAAVFSLQE